MSEAPVTGQTPREFGIDGHSAASTVLDAPAAEEFPATFDADSTTAVAEAPQKRVTVERLAPTETSRPVRSWSECPPAHRRRHIVAFAWAMTRMAGALVLENLYNLGNMILYVLGRRRSYRKAFRKIICETSVERTDDTEAGGAEAGGAEAGGAEAGGARTRKAAVLALLAVLTLFLALGGVGCRQFQNEGEQFVWSCKTVLYTPGDIARDFTDLVTDTRTIFWGSGEEDALLETFVMLGP